MQMQNAKKKKNAVISNEGSRTCMLVNQTADLWFFLIGGICCVGSLPAGSGTRGCNSI